MRILLVEDEQGVANFIKKGLEEEHFTVDHAVNGEDGLSYVKKNRYDLVILDVMLPGMSGIDLCGEIRRLEIQTPVLMLTAKDSVKDKVLGLNTGADDYLTKPFSFDEFLARINALLRRKQDRATELSYKDLRVDIVSHRVYIGDKEVVLRPKEYAVLAYLIKNKGKVMSRSQMLADIWGYDFNPQTNFVDVHIKSLREKLGQVSSAAYIHSVRGVGYMIGN
ncbi:MAG: response regulator transcription factor [Nitrospirae bacterium]|nr:response regulator transcription factor [Nitrospirota bacterium]